MAFPPGFRLPLPMKWYEMQAWPYFGPSSPEGPRKMAQPVGAWKCPHCGEGFTQDDHGFYVGKFEGTLPGAPTHLECFVRSCFGSVAHQEGRCGCHIPMAGDDEAPGLTARQHAVEAYLCWYNRNFHLDRRQPEPSEN